MERPKALIGAAFAAMITVAYPNPIEAGNLSNSYLMTELPPPPPAEPPEEPLIEAAPESVKELFTPEDTLKALEYSSPLVFCATYYEIGQGSKKYAPWDPNAVSPAGAEGPGQLHPNGKMVEFYRRGNTDHKSPYQVMPYLEWAFENGQQWHWDPITFGNCDDLTFTENLRKSLYSK